MTPSPLSPSDIHSRSRSPTDIRGLWSLHKEMKNAPEKEIFSSVLLLEMIASRNRILTGTSRCIRTKKGRNDSYLSPERVDRGLLSVCVPSPLDREGPSSPFSLKIASSQIERVAKEALSSSADSRCVPSFSAPPSSAQGVWEVAE